MCYVDVHGIGIASDIICQQYKDIPTVNQIRQSMNVATLILISGGTELSLRL